MDDTSAVNVNTDYEEEKLILKILQKYFKK